ncbi:uncharacterized protein [Miscanthus floridulus]|uniref:uncharacterized protein n=1 Tax=Miscanthus floridulus TaxID=154761 RepID=UPI00345B29F2
MVESIVLTPHTSDRFIWRWMATGNYTASSAYRAFFTRMTSLVGAKQVWRAATPPKVKFFWLALHGRLCTPERRQRHGLQQEATCTLCDQHHEILDHLLASCTYTCEVRHLLAMTGLQRFGPSHDARLADWWQQTRADVPRSLRRGFDSLVLLVSWILWKERNRRTFHNVTKSPAQVFSLICDEADSWIAAGYRSLAALFAAVN